jgi:hypothetical protein
LEEPVNSDYQKSLWSLCKRHLNLIK